MTTKKAKKQSALERAATQSVLERGEKAQRKKQFVKALAQFLAGTQAKKSILLGLPNGPAFSLAEEWAQLRSASPLMGFPTVEEAEKQLDAWLSEF